MLNIDFKKKIKCATPSSKGILPGGQNKKRKKYKVVLGAKV